MDKPLPLHPLPKKSCPMCVVRLGLKESIKKLKPKFNIFRNELLMRKSINHEDRVRSSPDGCNLQERVKGCSKPAWY